MMIVTIKQAVSDYDSSKFTYIDPNGANSPFAGHDWCSQDRYFGIVSINNTGHIFHPTVAGQGAYAEIVRGFVE